MSELLDMIKTRRSIRKYKSDMVPKEIIDKIVEAGTYAATGMGQQSPIILAVTNKEVRDKLSKWNADIMGTDTDPFYGAPVVLVVLADKNRPTAISIHTPTKGVTAILTNNFLIFCSISLINFILYLKIIQILFIFRYKFIFYFIF